ncbi:MAG: hypothetical protein Q4G08_04565 [Capnocytophaga sp.]|nr:hypothetical protein [Capnocytophaga sp.]
MSKKYFYLLPPMGILVCNEDFTANETQIVEVSEVVQEGLIGKRFFFAPTESLS